MGVLIIILGIVVDWVKVNTKLSVTSIRKYFTCISMMLQGLMFMGSSYIEDRTINVLLIILGLSFGAASYPGKIIVAFKIDCLDSIL